MNLLFVHDHKFRRCDEKLYSPGGLSNEILSRYVNWFGNVKVIGRILDESAAKSHYSEIKNPRVKILESGELKNSVQSSDALIIRLPSINGYKAIWYAKKFKKPYLIEVVGCTWDAYVNYGLKGKLFAVPAYLLMRICVNSATHVIYVTEEFLQNRYPCKCKCIGISDVEIHQSDKTVIDKRIEKIKRENEKLILGTIGAVDVSYKGQEYVIKAIPAIEKAIGKPVEYHLIGGGLPERLQNIAKINGVENRIVFAGVVPHEKIFNYLDELDIYIQPSLLEGLCRALVEAMSRGLPCVASDCGGNPELVSDEFLFSVNKAMKIPENIAECICSLLQNDSMSVQARKNFLKANEKYNAAHLDFMRNEFYLNYFDFVNRGMKSSR